MKKRHKSMVIALFAGVALSLHFTNCSQYSETGDNSASSLCADCGNTLPSTPSLRITSTYLDVNCGEDHIQIGGICNPGENIYSQIDYTIKRGSFTFDTRSAAGICESGRFFIIVRRPTDPDASALCTSYNECRIPYQVSARLMIGASKSASLSQGSSYNSNVTFQNGCL